ncbi:putative ribonuclease H-like domain-containing protein [Tanacetum coccineum]|uniref:Ribonuclease H-like domain-containing protein n=1 Tax=Tanacetum coccineum TaxID=301880 RepID=A0ABQ5FQZ7_9ASTR
MSGSQDEIPPPPPPPSSSQKPTQQTHHTVSTIKLHILKKGECDIWAMKMEHYLAHKDYLIWEVIQNGNGPPDEEKKSKDHFAMAFQKDNLAKFHKMTDAKDMWEAIKSRFGGNDESKKMQKYILKQQFEGFSVSNSEGLHKGYDRSLPSAWSQVSLIMRNKPGVDSLSFDDMYNNLRVFENDVKGSTASSSSTQNVAFVSENTSSTNDKNGDFENGQVALIFNRDMKSFYKKTGRTLQFDAKEPNSGNKDGRRSGKQEHSKALVTIDGEGVDWTSHSEKEEDFALMACNISGSDIEYWLGYGDHRYDGILSYENEVLQSVFMNKESELVNQPLYDRFVTAGGMHVVPPPMTGNYMPSGPYVEIDYSKFTYGPKQSQPSESETQTSDFDTCESDCSVETNEPLTEPTVNKPKVVYQPKVWSDSPIIEEYESDSEDEHVSQSTEEQKKPSFANQQDMMEHKAYLLNIGLYMVALLLLEEVNGDSEKDAESAQDFFVLPIWSSYYSIVQRSTAKDADELERLKRQEQDANDAAEAIRMEFAQETKDLLLQAGAAKPSSTNILNTASTPVSTASPYGGLSFTDPTNPDQDDSEIPALEDIYKNPTYGIFTNSSYDDEGAVADFTNLEPVVNVSPIPTSKITSIHPSTLILGDPKSAVQTRSKVTKSSGAHAFIQKVWILVDLPYGKKAIGTKWVYKNKKDERRVVVRNKVRLVAQGHRQEEGIDYDEDKYVVEILKKFNFVSVKTASTPIETQKPLVKDEEASDVDYPRVSSFDLEAYSDSDYAGANLDRKSTTRGYQFLGRRLISWQCKKQTIVATSTTKAEYVAAANCCRQVLLIQNQLLDYGFNFMNKKIYIDNESTICIVKNPVYHSKIKHIAIRHHFIRDAYEKKLIQVLKINTDDNVADLLTKAFDVSMFQFLVVTLRMINP